MEKILQDDYFKRLPPKTTGRELFHGNYATQWRPKDMNDKDFIATLTELTAASIADAYAKVRTVFILLIQCSSVLEE